MKMKKTQEYFKRHKDWYATFFLGLVMSGSLILMIWAYGPDYGPKMTPRNNDIYQYWDFLFIGISITSIGLNMFTASVFSLHDHPLE